MDEKEFAEASAQVLFPDAHGKPLTVKGKAISLRPLPIKQVKILNAKIKPIEERFQALRQGAEKGEDQSGLDAIGFIAETYMDLLAHLLNFYGVEGASKEWIEENLPFDEVEQIIAMQLSVQRQDDFLLAPVRLIFKGITQMKKTMAETQFQSPPSGPASPNPGTSTLIH